MVRPADPQRYRGGWPKPRPILESKAATGVTTWRQHGGRPGHWQSRGGSRWSSEVSCWTRRPRIAARSDCACDSAGERGSRK